MPQSDVKSKLDLGSGISGIPLAFLSVDSVKLHQLICPADKE